MRGLAMSSAQESSASDLVSIAAEIRVVYNKVEQNEQAVRLAQQGTLKYAIRLGELLTEAKSLMKHGEWLPWLEDSFPGDPRTAQRYLALAANTTHVSHLGSVREALEAISRIRPAPKSKPKPNPRPKPPESKDPELWEREEVLKWVARRMEAGNTRDEMMKDANAGKHGWPMEGAKFPQNAVDRARAIVTDRQTTGRPVHPPKPKPMAPEPRVSGKRLRQLQERKRQEGVSKLIDLQTRVMKAVSVLEGFEIADVGLSEVESEKILSLHDDLTILSRWLINALAVVEANMDDLTFQRRIKHFDAVIADPSAKPGEKMNAASMRDDAMKRRSAKRLSAGSA